MSPPTPNGLARIRQLVRENQEILANIRTSELHDPCKVASDVIQVEENLESIVKILDGNQPHPGRSPHFRRTIRGQNSEAINQDFIQNQEPKHVQ